MILIYRFSLELTPQLTQQWQMALYLQPEAQKNAVYFGISSLQQLSNYQSVSIRMLLLYVNT